MLLERLIVGPFRGIGPKLELDLTAKLTIIYAPNGTGKTTLCDAIEWTFTGNVVRLREAFGRSSGRELYNIFMPEQEPYAECVFRAGTKIRKIRREGIAKPASIDIWEDGSYRPKALDELLAVITPQTLPIGAPGVQSVQLRRNWLRTARFLEPESLALLIDSDKGGEQRDLAFSELLGVGELQRQDRDLSRIIRNFRSEAQINKERDGLVKQIEEIQAQLKAQTTQSTTPHADIFRRFTRAAREKLILTASAEIISREAEIAELQRACAEAEDKLAKRKELFLLVQAEIASYQAVVGQFENFAKVRTELAASMAAARTAYSAAQSANERANAELARAEALARTLDEIPISSAEGKLLFALGAWQTSGGDVTKEIDLGALQADLAVLRQKWEGVGARLQNLQRCEVSIPTWRNSREHEKQALATLAGVVTPTPEQLRIDEKEAAALKAELAEVESAYARLSTPLQQLKALGREFVAKAPAEHYCPLCHHDHGSAERLREAIASHLASLPVALEALANKKSGLEKRIPEVEARLKAIIESQRSAQRARMTLEEVRRGLNVAKEILHSFGLELTVLERLDVAAVLNGIRGNLEKNRDELEKAIRQAEAKIRAAEALHEAANLIETLSAQISAIVSISDLSLRLHELPLNLWSQYFDILKNRVTASSQEARAKVNDARKTAEESRSTLETHTRNLTSLDTSALDIAKKLGALESLRNEFEARWNQLLPSEKISADKLASLPSAFEQVSINIGEVKRDLATAHAALLAIAEIEHREREAQARNKEISQIRNRIGELNRLSALRAECERGIQILRRAKDQYISGQIRPMSDVITALYLKAQSNTFIDRIEADVERGPLQWLARIGEARLADTAEMSLGQRQDLAIAIFLARAREIGGSFILDEPLLHLDDLNRMGLLDVLRTFLIEDRESEARLILTTANMSLVRHLREKLAQIRSTAVMLRVYQLRGEPKSGVSAEVLSGHPKHH